MKSRVLIVDDEPSVRRAIGRLLRRMAVTVVPADNGQSALQLLDTERFDLVLCDLRMPILDGVELLRHLQARFSYPPPFVLLTGYSPAELTGLRDQGASEVLTKPVDPSQLRSTVRRLLQSGAGPAAGVSKS